MAIKRSGANALVNDTLKSLADGVTQQYQEGRFESQVSAMVNCMPSITRGVMRRNPTKAIAHLDNLASVDLENAFTYSYDRGTDGEQYIIVIDSGRFIRVFNANTGTHLYSTAHYYLDTPVGIPIRDCFKAITIGDHTFIVNTTQKPKFTTDTASSTNYSNAAFYWIKKTANVVTDQFQDQVTSGTQDPDTGDLAQKTTVESGSRIEGYTYFLNFKEVQGLADTRPNKPTVSRLASKEITAAFVADPTYSLVNKQEGSIAYTTTFQTGVGVQDWIWNDSFGNEASLGVWKSMANPEDLPAEIPQELDKFKVKITGGTSSGVDDYYLEYRRESKGWKEIPSPGSLTTLDPWRMPHVLYRLSDGSFKFDHYEGLNESGTDTDGVSKWGKRQTGGDFAIDDPSFMGKEIKNIFFYKNRLGFLTADSVVLSQTGDYGNFFVQTLQEVLDDDVIDLSVASTDVTILRHAVPTAGQLILFADDTQFSLQSTNGPLTPTTADIVPLSNYTYGRRTDAKAIGNRVFFANQVGGYSQIYAYRITDQGSQLTEAIPMTIHLPTYIDNTIHTIIGHDVLGYTFMVTDNDPYSITVLTSTIRGNEALQNAFHKWDFKYKVSGIFIINNDLYILFNNKDLCKINLAIPDRAEDTSYLDSYSSTDSTPYVSSILFSEFFVRDGEGQGTVRGRYQIRTLQYAIEDYSKYVTTIYNKNHEIISNNSTIYGPNWDDSGVWDDTLLWSDTNPFYERSYTNDDKITVMSNSKKVLITFRSSIEEPDKGFELNTVNIEGMFNQRSTRI